MKPDEETGPAPDDRQDAERVLPVGHPARLARPSADDLRIVRSLAGCVCPDDYTLAVACKVHFGDGYGHCIPHAVDVRELLAAVGVRNGVPLCASCLAAPDRRRLAR